jgi:anti-sigma regulatory factor (Ser/Thr protein kinase)
MEDLSLHILDIAENATTAGATLVEIFIRQDSGANLLSIVIRDNGEGMDRRLLEGARDPFVTTRENRRVGLGLPLLAQAAEEAGGDFSVNSEPGRGTEVKTTFEAGHIDRKPLGDMGSTLLTLIIGNPEVDFLYESDLDGERTTIDTRSIRAQLDEHTSISDPRVLNLIRSLLNGDRKVQENASIST